MKLNEIKDIAFEAASKYYKHCEEKAGAVARIPIKKIEKETSYWIFTLSKDLLYDKDKYDVSVNGKVIDKRNYNFLKYDDEKRQLFVSFNIRFDFPLTVENVHIESNLLFLVENVKKWYENPHYTVRIPTDAPFIPFSPTSEKYTPSEEQMEAVNNIKCNVLSYVWGAPGTGKTQFILARCIADYIQKFIKFNSKHKIIVCAPTNNALEQILFGVFKVLEEENISTDLVIRLGMPSKKFASQYPNSCECLSVENKIQKIEKQINELKTILVKRKEITEIADFNLIFTKASEELCQVHRTKNQLEDKIAQTKSSIDNIQLELSEIRIEIYKAKLEYHEAQKKAQRILNRIIKSNKTTTQYEADVLNVKLHKLRESEINKNAENVRLNSELVTAQEELCNLKEPEDIKKDLFYLLKKYNYSDLPVIQSILSYLRVNIQSQIDDFLDLAIKKCSQIIESNRAIIETSQFGKMEDSEISSKIEQLNAECHELNDKGTKSQIANSNVIALTVDRFILEYELLYDLIDDDINEIEHIFVDEAAYLCMIKGLTLFSLKKPITLLGDHMQLPPVFECEKALIKENPFLSLWEIPIIYCEELFQNDFYTFLTNYQNNISPLFHNLSKTNLNTTYRFGDNLANILRGTVYSDAFHSANNENPTKITTINAVRIPTNKRRVNPLEIDAIHDYVEFFSKELKSFVVLTPYRNQFFELQNALPRETNCMTIHASQGQEWDTVIVSAVDTFMARDVRLINTAVSRAKKHLIVVCDTEEWKTHPKYLISKIISHSDKIIDYKNISSYEE